jgi:mono/diheme cytochrome c family protein
MKTLMKLLGGLVLCFILIAGGVYLWASLTTNRAMARTFEVHTVDFPIPFPLTEEEVAALGGGDEGIPPEELERIAMERAIERGRHLVSARYACVECHGNDFGGGVMIDAFPIGTLLGPNITLGTGSRTLEYTATDWDRIVRHGVRPDGTGATMPSEDFQLMSDQELSDVVAYIRSHPPVDAEVPPVSFGPLGKILVATKQLGFSADRIPSHDSPHGLLPPVAEVSMEFGRHLAGICTGCHTESFAGGPIVGGDPSWVPARNLTPHESALGSWSYEDFARVMLEGVRPDGEAIQLPMTLILPYAQQMTEVELQALWTYLQSVPPIASEN